MSEASFSRSTSINNRKMRLTFVPLFYPNHQNKLKIINPKLKLVHLFVLAVRSSLSIESKGHGPCIAAY